MSKLQFATQLNTHGIDYLLYIYILVLIVHVIRNMVNSLGEGLMLAIIGDLVLNPIKRQS